VTLSFPVAPMKATLGSLPPPKDDALWAYEIKWDGHRTLGFVHDGAVRLQSSLGNDVTGRYPELAPFVSAVNAHSAILDGEVVALDPEGRPSFDLLQRHATQAAFYVFDVLQIDGTDTVSLPYEQRRALLQQLVEPGSNWLVPAHRIGDGAALVEVTAEQGLEGVMAKRLGSPYVPGSRTTNWLKVKHRRIVEVAVAGFTPGKGARASTFGALLVGVAQPDGSLRFAGGVGTGFTQADLEALHMLLLERVTDDCPFPITPPRSATGDAVWVVPDLRVTLEIAEFTNDGAVRHASFLGLAP
jgi:bifunctional non-homologous end joining protein LigD